MLARFISQPQQGMPSLRNPSTQPMTGWSI
jgi:hypothetical protein